MKKILFLIVLMLGLVSCGAPKEIALPNKNIKVENGAITFKGKPYTGKIKMNLSDKVQGYNGFLSFKDGHFDGLSEIKNEKQKMHIKFTVLNGKFEGEVISKMPQMGEATYNFKQGKLETGVANLMDGTKMNVTYDDKGRINGTMEIGGQTANFKDGEAPFQGGTLKAVINYEKEKVEMSFYQGSKLLQNIDSPILTVSLFEQMLFPVLAQ